MVRKRYKYSYMVVCVVLVITMLFCSACNRQYSPKTDKYFFDALERLNHVVFGAFSGIKEETDTFYTLNEYEYYVSQSSAKTKNPKDFGFSYKIPARYGSFGSYSYIRLKEIELKKQDVNVKYKDGKLSFYNRSFEINDRTFYDYPWKSRILTNEFLTKPTVTTDVTKSSESLIEYFSSVYPDTRYLGGMKNVNCEIEYAFTTPINQNLYYAFLWDQERGGRDIKFQSALIKTGDKDDDIILRVRAAGSVLNTAKRELSALKDENHKRATELLLSSDLFGINLDIDKILEYWENNPFSVVGFVCETSLPQEGLLIYQNELGWSNKVLIKQINFINYIFD